MSNVLDELTTKRDAEIDAVETIMSREDYNPEDPALVASRDQVEKLNRSIKERTDWEQLKASSDKLTATRANLTRDDGHRQQGAPEYTPGEMFVRSDVYQSYPGRGTSSRVELNYRATSLPTLLADFAALVPKATPRNITPPDRYTLLDLLPGIPVSSNSVETVVWSNSGGTTALVVAEGQPKPDVEFTATITPYTLATIAAWTQMSRQMLEDQPFVAAQINQLLTREIKIKSESEAAAALVAATLPTAVSAASLLAAIRLGMGTVESEGYDPNAVLLNPADYAALDIDVFTRTLNGTRVNSAFWGLTPVAHKAQVAGTATVGDFGAGVQRYTRTGVNTYITDSHASTFISNVFTVLAESREKTVVVQPKALCECTKNP